MGSFLDKYVMLFGLFCVIIYQMPYTSTQMVKLLYSPFISSELYIHKCSRMCVFLANASFSSILFWFHFWFHFRFHFWFQRWMPRTWWCVWPRAPSSRAASASQHPSTWNRDSMSGMPSSRWQPTASFPNSHTHTASRELVIPQRHQCSSMLYNRRRSIFWHWALREHKQQKKCLLLMEFIFWAINEYILHVVLWSKSQELGTLQHTCFWWSLHNVTSW